jgi:hypothetical protein
MHAVVTKSGRIFVSPDVASKDVKKGYTPSVLEPPSETASGWNASKLPKTGKAGTGTSVADDTPWVPLIRERASQDLTEKSSKAAKSGRKR